MNNTEEQKYVWIPGELRTDTTENIVVSTDQVFDKKFPTLEEINGKLTPSQTEIGEDQETINKYVRDKLNNISDKTPFIQNQKNGIQGQGGTARGNNSFAIGDGTITSNPNEVAVGKYNKSEEDTIFSVGIGTDNQNRKNAFEIRENGDIYFGDNINLVNLLNELSNVFIKVSDPDDEEVQGIISCFTKINDELKKVGQGSVNLSKNGRSGGDYSLTVGDNTITSKIGEVALGQYNVSNENTIFSIGDGTSDDQRHNIFEIRVGSDNQFGIYFNDQDLYTLIKNISGLNPDDISNLNRLLQTKADLKDVPVIKNGSGIVIKESTKDGRPIKTILANLLDENPQDRNVEFDPKYYPVEIDENGRLAVHIAEDIERISISINDQELKDKVTITYTITPIEGDSETNSFIWNGSNHIIEVPYGAQYNITASSVNGYSCSNPTFSGTADQSNVNHQFLYQKVTTTINRSSNQIDNLPAGTATLTWTENGTTKSQLINFSSGSNSIGVNGIPLNIPITIKYGEIDGYKKPNDVVITFTSSVTSNSDTGGGYKGCKVTLNTTSNQSSDVDIKNTYINIKYGNNTKTVNRNKSVMIPLDSTITCKFSEVSGYNKPQDVEYTLSEVSKIISGEYKTTVVTLNMTGGDATFNITSTSMSQQKSLSSGESIKIPTGDIVTYIVGTIEGKQYTSNLSSGFTATGASQTININFSDVSSTVLEADIVSNLGGEYTEEIRPYGTVKVWQYSINPENGNYDLDPTLYAILKHGEIIGLDLKDENNNKYKYSYSFGPILDNVSFNVIPDGGSAPFFPVENEHYYSSNQIIGYSGNADDYDSQIPYFNPYIEKRTYGYDTTLEKVRVINKTGVSFKNGLNIIGEVTVKNSEIEENPVYGQFKEWGMDNENMLVGQYYTPRAEKGLPRDFAYSQNETITKLWSENSSEELEFLFTICDVNVFENLKYTSKRKTYAFKVKYPDGSEFDYPYEIIKHTDDDGSVYNDGVEIILGFSSEGAFPIDYTGVTYQTGESQKEIGNKEFGTRYYLKDPTTSIIDFIVPKEESIISYYYVKEKKTSYSTPEYGIYPIINELDNKMQPDLAPIGFRPIREKIINGSKTIVSPNHLISSGFTTVGIIKDSSGKIDLPATIENCKLSHSYSQNGYNNTTNVWDNYTDDEKYYSENNSSLVYYSSNYIQACKKVYWKPIGFSAHGNIMSNFETETSGKLTPPGATHNYANNTSTWNSDTFSYCPFIGDCYEWIVFLENGGYNDIYNRSIEHSTIEEGSSKDVSNPGVVGNYKFLTSNISSDRNVIVINVHSVLKTYTFEEIDPLQIDESVIMFPFIKMVQ